MHTLTLSNITADHLTPVKHLSFATSMSMGYSMFVATNWRTDIEHQHSTGDSSPAGHSKSSSQSKFSNVRRLNISSYLDGRLNLEVGSQNKPLKLFSKIQLGKIEMIQ